MVDRAQVQAFLLGYLSGQLGLLTVPDTLVRTWSQPAGHTTNDNVRGKQWRLRHRGGHVISSASTHLAGGGGFSL